MMAHFDLVEYIRRPDMEPSQLQGCPNSMGSMCARENLLHTTA